VLLLPGQLDPDAEVPLSLGAAAEALDPIAGRILDAIRENSPWTAIRHSGTDDGLLDTLPPGIGSLAAVRIERVGVVYGALCILYAEPQAFEVGLLDLLAGFANQAAMAIANAHLLEATEVERARLSAILDSVPEGVLVVDSDFRLRYANPAAEDRLGLSPKAFGRPLDECVSISGLVRFLDQPGVETRAADFAGEGGRRLQVVVRGIRESGSDDIWRVCAVQDVTRLSERDDRKSDFVNTVSHDLRRPLTMIEGQVHMVEMLGPLNAAQQDYARRIRLSAQHMNRLVKDLLDLGRLEGGAEIRRVPVRIGELVRRLVEELRPESSSANVRLTMEIPDGLPDLPADPALLERALVNLLENAIRFNRPGGSVSISASVEKDALVIAVRDDGIGIAPADQARVFEKFYRVNPQEDAEHPAWGLGLAIVRNVTAWHGGRVWVESRLGHGSTFYLALPLKG
jgi:signal transduction histidine kinase